MRANSGRILEAGTRTQEVYQVPAPVKARLNLSITLVPISLTLGLNLPLGQVRKVEAMAWPVPGGPTLLAPKDGLHASRRAAKQAVFCVDKPKAPFKPVFGIATTREGSEVVLVHDPEAEPRIADQPPPHGHGLEADSCLW